MKRAIVVVFVLTAGCFSRGAVAPVPPPAPVAPVSDKHDPALPSVYTVPLDAKDNDLVCADTVATMNFKPCMKVRRFRAFVLDPKL